MSATQARLTAPESESRKLYPHFDNADAERDYLIECEARGRASLFFMVCGSCAEGLALCENDPVAFWPGAWDSLPAFMRRRICMLLDEFPLCPSDFAGPNYSASEHAWKSLSQPARRHAVRVTPSLVKFTRERLALLLGQAG